jgi:hypothetical protein
LEAGFPLLASLVESTRRKDMTSELKRTQKIENAQRLERLLERTPAKITLVTELVRSTGNVIEHIDCERDDIEFFAEEFTISRDQFTADVERIHDRLICNAVEMFCAFNLPKGEWCEKDLGMALALTNGLELRVRLFVEDESLAFDFDHPLNVLADTLLQKVLA